MQSVINLLKRILIFLLSFLALTFLYSTNVQAASFKFNPATKSFEKTCQRSISIDVNPEGEVSNAAEIEVTYDPNVITIIDQNPNISGIQVTPGNAFETYFYNNVNTTTGTIKLAGASFFSTLSTNKTFATITFTSSASATTTNFDIRFDHIGATTDSNIADALTSNDLLSSVTNGSYTFINGPCEADTTAPQVVFQSPTNGATGVALTSNVTLQITDDLSGVDLDSLRFIISGVSYQVSDTEVTYTGNANNYNFTINPADDFPTDQASTVVVTGNDISGNSFSKQIIFNIPQAQPVTTDTDEPVVGFISPINLDTNISVNDNIIITLGDDGSGVDLSTVIFYVNGQQVTVSTPGVQVAGNQNSYTITIPGTGRILANQVNFLRVVGSDFDGNSFDRQIVFNIPTQTQCPTDNTNNQNPDTTTDNPDNTNTEVPDIVNDPVYQDLLNDFQNNPDQLQEQVKNCYGQEIEINEVPSIVSEVLKSQNLLKGTVLENSVVDSIAQETSTSGLAALFAIILLSLNILPIFSLLAAVPGLGAKLFGVVLGKESSSPWGVVTSGVDNKPISFAVCQIFTQGSQFKITQTISDLEGRYGFILSPGQYRLEVKQSGYKEFKKDITINEGEESFIYDIKLVPTTQSDEYKTNIISETLKAIFKVYKKLSVFLFFFGYIFSIISIFVSPSLINLVVFLIFTLVTIGYLVPILMKKPKFAAIVDAESGLRIPFAQIKIFDSKTWQLVDSKVTNYNGQFDYYGKPGTYGISVEARGYKFPSLKTEYKFAENKNNSIILVDLKQGKNNIKIYLDPLENRNESGTGNLNSPFSG